MNILITGSSGLIGSSIGHKLESSGYKVIPFDIKASGEGYGDIRNIKDIEKKLVKCSGVIHLASVSRVIDAENNPEECWTTNVVGTQNIINAIRDSNHKPWMIYASSREVYGNSCALPVPETAKLRPVNVYGYTKVASEKLVNNLRTENINTAIVRFSNVYGSASDHVTRVVPAFCHAVLNNNPIYIEGLKNTFDFTFIDDVTDGLFSIINAVEKYEKLPELHLVSGVQTSLSSLAKKVFYISGKETQIIEKPPRTYDVSNFCGDNSLAIKNIGWKHSSSLENGIEKLIHRINKYNLLPYEH